MKEGGLGSVLIRLHCMFTGKWSHQMRTVFKLRGVDLITSPVRSSISKEQNNSTIKNQPTSWCFWTYCWNILKQTFIWILLGTPPPLFVFSLCSTWYLCHFCVGIQYIRNTTFFFFVFSFLSSVSLSSPEFIAMHQVQCSISRNSASMSAAISYCAHTLCHLSFSFSSGICHSHLLCTKAFNQPLFLDALDLVWTVALPPRRTTVAGLTMCSNCGSSRPASFQPRNAITANFVWTTCCTPAPPASPGPTRCSGASTLNSTTSPLSVTFAFICTRRRTRRDARWSTQSLDYL